MDHIVNCETVATFEQGFKWRTYQGANHWESQFIGSTTDTAQNVISYEYYGDPSDTFDYTNTRLKKITYPDNSYVEYTYDQNGNRTSVRDNNGNTWNYSYDSNNHLTSTSDPSGIRRLTAMILMAISPPLLTHSIERPHINMTPPVGLRP